MRYLPFLLGLALTLYCLIDCIQTPEGETRNLGKVWWILLILIFPPVGPLAWLFAGRPRRDGGRRRGPRPRPVGPDDDPDFLASLDPPRKEDPRDRE